MKKIYFEDIENLDELIEVCIKKTSGVVDKSWREIVEEFQLEIKPEALSRFGKYITLYRNVLMKNGELGGEEILQELKKEKMKVADQRRELNRSLRESARMDNILETFEQHLEERDRVVIPESKQSIIDNPVANREMLVFFSDIHYGIKVDNEVNFYDTKEAEICFSQMLQDTIDLCILFRVDKIKVLLGGDIVSGIIHTNLRLQQVEDVITQVLKVADLIEDFCVKLKQLGLTVELVGTIGNHSRIMADRKQNLSSENFERIIFKQLEKAGFKVQQDSDVALFNLANMPVAALHGNQCNEESAFEYVVKRKKTIPTTIFMAHYHRDNRTDRGCPVIINGSMVGPDEYAIDKGFISTPHQKIIIYQEDIGELLTYKSNFIRK